MDESDNITSKFLDKDKKKEPKIRKKTEKQLFNENVYTKKTKTKNKKKNK